MKSLEDAIALKEIEKTELTRKLFVGGKAKIFPVYRVPLSYLYYNDHNDRIVSWISKYKAENNVSDFDKSNLEEYNDIIEEFLVKSNPKAMTDTKNNIKLIGQQVPGVVLDDGRIVDGNRRFTCLRQLARDDVKYGFIEVVILDKYIGNNEKEVKRLELMLQHGEEKPVDYNPIDRLVGIYTDIVDKRLLTIKEYAISTNTKESIVKSDVEISKIMVEFLEFIGAPKAYFIANDLELDSPFREMYMAIRTESNPDKIEDIKNILFANIVAKPDKDMTRYLRRIKSILKDIKLAKPYLDEQLKYAGEVLDLLNEKEGLQSSLKNIKENINTVRDNPVVERMQDSTELYRGKVEAIQIKNKPLNLIENAKTNIREIEPEILDKMSERQRKLFFETLDEIVDYLTTLKNDYYS